MFYLDFILVSGIIFPIAGVVSGADECRTQTLFCYDCDSRHDPNCNDPFNRTLPPELKPTAKVCQGCCVKMIHIFSYGEWVQRTCTENLLINYFMVDHVCMGEGKGHGKMCFCEENYCNGVNSWSSSSTHIKLICSLSVIGISKIWLLAVAHG